MTRVLLRGGSVYSPADPFATAMLVDGDTVAWLGADSAAQAHLDAADVVVDLDGALVTPAFVDPHVHATSTGIALDGLDLTSATSLAECLDTLERFAQARRGHHVLGHGWDQTRWPEQRPPTRQELDRASYGGVVYLTRIDVHSAVASSALLAALPEISGLDGYDDSGLLTREAHHVARAAALATIGPDQRRRAQALTRSRAASLGIAVVHELGGPEISSEDDFAAMLALGRDEPGPDVVGYWGELDGPGRDGVARAQSLGALGAAGDLFADGAIGSRTAAMRDHYHDHDTCGAAYLSADQVRDHLVACTRAGVQGGFHVIGDAAADAVVEGMRAAAEITGVEAFRAARHRLEHLEMVDAEGITVLAELGVHASMQPVFDELWGGEHGMYVARLGTDRARGMNAFASLAAAGVPLAFGSDSPVTPLGPWRAVRAAAAHRTPEERISVRAAFAAHTRGGWRAAGRDDAGVLAPGAPAYYTIWQAEELVVQAPDGRVAAWSTDPRSGTPGLPRLEPDDALPTCLRTVAAGRTIHDTRSLQETTR